MSNTINVRLPEMEQAMRNLPDPNTHPAEYYRKFIPDQISARAPVTTALTLRVVTFRKEKFGTGTKTWFEWTLDLNA